MKQFDREANLRLIKALRLPIAKGYYRELQSSDELHAFADNYNWDDGEDALNWIVQNPECDLGTALQIYWEIDPEHYYSQFSSRLEIPDKDWQAPGYDLLKAVEHNLEANFYTKSDIYFFVSESDRSSGNFAAALTPGKSTYGGLK